MRTGHATTTLALLLAPTAAFVPAVRPAVAPAAVPLMAPLRPLRAAALPALPADARARVVASGTAAAAPPPRTSLVASVARAAAWCLASALALLLTTARVAFAAERTLRRAAPVAAGVDLSGYIKYAFVGGCMAAGYFFQKPETPRFVETPGAAVLDLETLKPLEETDASPAAAAPPADAAVPEAPPAAPVPLDDDSAIFGSLQARMQALAEEKAAATEEGARAADEDDAAAPPADSSDDWGTGSTAVLERPEAPDGEDAPPRGVLDGDAPVEFPPGFPLVDGEVVEMDTAPAAASADQIAMLNRMFGSAAPEE